MKTLQLCFLLLLLSLSAWSQSDISKAAKYYSDSKFSLAEAELLKVLKNSPDDLTAIELLGDSYAAQKSWEKALQQYTRLKAIRPKVADYHYKYGGALGMIAKESNKFKALGMIPDFRAAFEEAIRLDKNHIGARWALIELNLQLPAIVGGSESKAQQYAAELQKISTVDGYLAKGRIAEYFDRLTIAEKYYKAAFAIGQSKNTGEKLAALYVKMNAPEKAAAVKKSIKT
jgi:tetratricopeptide (TPR) repeat protein